MPSILYVLEVQTGFFNSQVLLNDIPVFTETNGRFLTSQSKVNQWIIEGTNKIEVRLGLPGNRVAIEEGNISRTFQLKLLVGEQGREPGPSGVLVTYDWGTEKNPVTHDMTSVYVKEFQPQRAFGKWVWQEIPGAQISSQDREQIIRIIRRIHGSLAAKDINSLRELLSTYTKEMAKALGMSEEELEQDQREFFQSLFSAPEWRMEPLNEASINLALIGGGRLVEAKGVEDKPLLKGSAVDRTYANNFTFGKVKGEWRILPESA